MKYNLECYNSMIKVRSSKGEILAYLRIMRLPYKMRRMQYHNRVNTKLLHAAALNNLNEV